MIYIIKNHRIICVLQSNTSCLIFVPGGRYPSGESVCLPLQANKKSHLLRSFFALATRTLIDK